MISRREFPLLAALVLAGCGPSNPLIGRWVMEDGVDLPPEGRLALAALRLAMGEIEFREASMVVRGSAQAVRYEITGNRVVVRGEGQSLTVEVDGNTAIVAVPNPLGREFRLRFRRA